eukprot:COSAG01_NODE_4988_length_4567_cov_3.954790_6_plen_156_part_00
MRVTYLSSKRPPELSDAMDQHTLDALKVLLERFAEEVSDGHNGRPASRRAAAWRAAAAADRRRAGFCCAQPRRPVLQCTLAPTVRSEAQLRAHFGEFGDVTLVEHVAWSDGEGWVAAPDAEAASSAYVHFSKTKMAEKALRLIDGDGDGELDKVR